LLDEPLEIAAIIYRLENNMVERDAFLKGCCRLIAGASGTGAEEARSLFGVAAVVGLHQR